MISGLAGAIPNFREAADPKVEAKALARLASDPQIKRQMQAFVAAVAKAKDLDTALKDPRVLSVFLQANGLGDQVGNAGLARRVLTGDPADTKALMNRLSDGRWKAVATSFSLKERGIEALRDPAVVEKLDRALRSLSWRRGLDATTAGLSDALYFRENAAKITTTYGLLGNAVMRRVLTGALGIPDELALQSVEAQKRVLDKRLSLKDLQDPRKVQKLAERYLMNANLAIDTGANGLSSLLNPRDALASIDLGAISNINLML